MLSCVNNADTEEVPLQWDSLETRTSALSNYFDGSPAAFHNKCPQTHQGWSHSACCTSLQIYSHAENGELPQNSCSGILGSLLYRPDFRRSAGPGKLIKQDCSNRQSEAPISIRNEHGQGLYWSMVVQHIDLVLDLHLRGEMLLNCNEIHEDLVFLSIKPAHKLL